jgi:cell division protease FtsH
MATKVARAMVTEYGMSAKLGAVKYGTGDDEPFLGRTYGTTPNYSHETAGEIDDEIRALIEAAHTEAWAVLNENRDILDALALELLEKETLDRNDLTRIFSAVVKRPKITSFDEFGSRVPSDRPPIKTPKELALERGEEWHPPAPSFARPVQHGNEGGYILPPGEPSQVGAGVNGANGYNGSVNGSSPYGYGQVPTGSGPQNGQHPQSGQYPATGPYPQNGQQPANGQGQYPVPGPFPTPPHWTGGVVSGPLGPLPQRGPGAPGAEPYGHGRPNLSKDDRQGDGGAQQGQRPADSPEDPWAPPRDQG